MRITTWNVNGIKTLPQYHPWNKLKTYDAILTELGGDITCIQETKITRAQLDAGLATPPNFDGFFSFYRGAQNSKPKGIHGTAIFTKRSTVVPLKAEEGLSSLLVPAHVEEDERIGGYALGTEVDLTHQEMRDLDAEGRTTVCDFGLFVLINLYSPNLTNEERIKFKNDFNTLVDTRARNLIKQGRQVIIVGDLNICRQAIDCANPEERAAEAGLESFEDTSFRRWLGEFTAEGGPMIDITRRLHPDRQGMFTCWNLKIDARPSNFGTRLDYILITPGLLPWVKDSNIQSSIIGSDHCPVYLDLHDSIPSTVEGEPDVQIWDVLNPGRSKEDPIPPPPAFAARHFDEFSGKQRKLASFFVKTPKLEESAGPVAMPSSSAPVKLKEEVVERVDVVVEPPSTAPPRIGGAPPASKLAPTVKTPKQSKAEPASKASPKLAGGQSTLAGFFLKPQPAEAKPKKTKRKSEQTPAPPPPSASASTATSAPPSSSQAVLDLTSGDEDDDPLAGLTPEQVEAALSSASASAAASASAWSGLMKPRPIPRCSGHGEPTKQWTVNKPGLNKGRKFYLCARPVGAANDREARCDFFAWDVSVRRPATAAELAEATGSSAKKAKV